MLHLHSNICVEKISKKMQALKDFSKSLEDPNNPLFGPTLWGLKIVGLWRINTTKLLIFIFNCVFLLEVVFVISEFIHLYFVRNDLAAISEALYMTGPTFVCLFKCMTYVHWQSDWRKLIEGVAQEEILVRDSGDPTGCAIMAGYIAYCRLIGKGYCVMLAVTMFFVAVFPFLTLFITPGLMKETLDGTKPYPQILNGMWYPFDHTTMPGYLVAILIQFIALMYDVCMTTAFDVQVVGFMEFFKGHLMILKEKCKTIFDQKDGEVTRVIVTQRIKECHRHHIHLIAMKNLYNSLVSPVMFIYVLLSSITICGSVIRFSLVAEQASEKAYTLEFLIAVILQLLLYCWHCNDVTVQSELVSGGVFASDWWQADVRMRRNLLLLAGQLTHSFTFSAGPFTLLTVSTFITIIKASYSFYTFLTQMKN